MKHTLTLMLGLAFLLGSGSAIAGTKVKITGGDFGQLAGKTSCKVTFDYSAAKVGKMTEADYVAREVAEKNEKEAGKGDEWAAAWEGDKASRYHPKFLDLINKYLAAKGIVFSEDAATPDLMATVFVLRIEPGFYSYVVNSPAYLDYEMVFTDAAGTELARVMVSNAEGMHATSFGSASAASRISESFAKGAKDMSKYLSKKIK